MTHLRVVNYHLTPRHLAATYDREFAALAAAYSPVTEDDLAAFFATGRWSKPKPGVLPVFYNGYRNNYDVARPLLDRHGLVGWFMAVPGFTEAADQVAFAAAHNLALSDDGPRHALSWEEMRALDGPHVIASHTRSHSRVSQNDPARLRDEILGAQEDFIRNLGHPVRAFAWLFGAKYGENPEADHWVDQAGYHFLFSNLALQRLRR